MVKSGELASKAFLHVTSAVFRARRLAARLRPAPVVEEPVVAATPRRNILFVTVDQQRFDALGITGGKVARTPVIDALGRDGIVFRRAHVHNVVCTARSRGCRSRRGWTARHCRCPTPTRAPNA